MIYHVTILNDIIHIKYMFTALYNKTIQIFHAIVYVI